MIEPGLQDVATQVRPFITTVNTNGQAFVSISHSLHGISWIVYQLGMSLGQPAAGAQCSAIFNAIPYVTSIVMGTALIGNFPGQPPIAMVSEMVGPPYTLLEAGDNLQVGVIGATPGDTFTVGAFMQEIDSPTVKAAENAYLRKGEQYKGYIPRPGARRWK